MTFFLVIAGILIIVSGIWYHKREEKLKLKLSQCNTLAKDYQESRTNIRKYLKARPLTEEDITAGGVFVVDVYGMLHRISINYTYDNNFFYKDEYSDVLAGSDYSKYTILKEILEKNYRIYETPKEEKVDSITDDEKKAMKLLRDNGYEIKKK